MSGTELELYRGLAESIHDVGYAMVRPDGLELGIAEDIIERIHDNGMQVLKRRISCISGDQVDALYPGLHERDFFNDMKASLVGKNVMSLIIGGEFNVGVQLLSVKGSALNTSGSIRADYSKGHLLEGELHLAFRNGLLSEEQLKTPECHSLLRDDRMHSDETTQEALNSIKTMFPVQDRSEVVRRFPNLRYKLLA
ncbi:MAG: nucleoside-diphosphate kinase [bacterium]